MQHRRKSNPMQVVQLCQTNRSNVVKSLNIGKKLSNSGRHRTGTVEVATRTIKKDIIAKLGEKTVLLKAREEH